LILFLTLIEIVFKLIFQRLREDKFSLIFGFCLKNILANWYSSNLKILALLKSIRMNIFKIVKILINFIIHIVFNLSCYAVKCCFLWLSLSCFENLNLIFDFLFLWCLKTLIYSSLEYMDLCACYFYIEVRYLSLNCSIGCLDSNYLWSFGFPRKNSLFACFENCPPLNFSLNSKHLYFNEILCDCDSFDCLFDL